MMKFLAFFILALASADQTETRMEMVGNKLHISDEKWESTCVGSFYEEK